MMRGSGGTIPLTGRGGAGYVARDWCIYRHIYIYIGLRRQSSYKPAFSRCRGLSRGTAGRQIERRKYLGAQTTLLSHEPSREMGLTFVFREFQGTSGHTQVVIEDPPPTALSCALPGWPPPLLPPWPSRPCASRSSPYPALFVPGFCRVRTFGPLEFG